MNSPAATLTPPARAKSAPAETPSGLKFEPRFATPGVSPFDEIEWDLRTAEITDDSGKAIFNQENVEVPRSLERTRHQDRGLEVLLRRHRQRHRPHKRRPRTLRPPAHPPRHPHDRRLGHRGRLLRRQGRAPKFSTRISPGCASISTAPSTARSGSTSASTSNTGSATTRGEGGWFCDAETGKAEPPPTQYEYPQASACFIQGVEDNMEDIMRLATSEAMLFKYGSGTGTDLSTLRSHPRKALRRRQAVRSALLPARSTTRSPTS